MNKFFFIILFLILSCSNSNAESLEPVTIIQHFGAEDGLGSKTVYSIVQDKEGFLWMATDAGVFRYDGNEFKRYTVDDGLSDNEILQLFVDKSGRIWFLTYNGYLSYYYKGIIYNSKNAPFLKKTYLGGSYVNAVEENGKIWLSSFKKGFCTIEDTVVKRMILPITEREMSFPFLAKDSTGSLWFFTLEQIKNFNSGETVNLSEAPFAYCSVNGLNEVVYLTKKGAFKLKNLVSKTIVPENLIPDYTKVVTVFYEKDLDNLWICTLGKGCTLFHDGKLVKTYLSNSSVTGVLRDTEGNIWFSTMNEGIYVFYKNNSFITNYNKSSGLPDNKVFSLAIDKKNNTWLGFYNGQVFRTNDNQKTIFQLRTWNNADYLRTMGIIAFRDTVWCANDGGIYYITNNKVTRIRYPDLNAYKNNYSVKHIVLDDSGQVYGSFSFNLLRVNKSPEGYCCKPIFDSIMRIFASVKSADGSIFVSTISGLMEYMPGKYCRILNDEYDFSKLRILDLKIDKNGDLLLATNVDGVFVMRKNKIISHITTKDRLSDNSCRKLYLENNLLYVCTQNGLNTFIKKNDQWVFREEINKRDGLLDNAINDVCTNDSMIFIATDGGYSIVSKKIFNEPHYLGNVYVSEVVVDKPYQVQNSSFAFNSTVPRFIVKFSYPVFNPANKIKFRYRLRKNDENIDWINTSNNEIQFSSLSPGKYLFEVMPFVKRKVVKTATLNIEVFPMWWQTFTARLIFAIISLVIITLIIKQWTRIQFEKKLRLLKQSQMIETERNRIASDMHDDIGADLTQISIWSNVLKSTEVSNKGIVEKITNLSNEVLSKMDQIIWALNSIHNQTNDLLSYLHSYSSEYLESADIDINFSVSENIPQIPLSMFQRRNVFLVIKEMLHNTVKHSGAQKVDIDISYDRKYLIIRYSDDGCGIDTTNEESGLGFTTMQKRMNEINSSIKIDNKQSAGMNAVLSILIDKI